MNDPDLGAEDQAQRSAHGAPPRDTAEDSPPAAVAEPSPAMPRPRDRRQPTVVLAVLTAAVTLTGLVAWLAGGRGVTGQALPGPIPLGDRQLCANTVRIVASTDDKMTNIAEALRSDLRVMRVYTQTKQESFQWFTATFANQPELLKFVDPDSLPASVIVIPMDQTELEALADQLRAQFPTAYSVDADNYVLSRLRGAPSTDPTCPSSGERPH